MLRNSLVHLGGYSWCLFPWLGTRSMRTLRKFISQNKGDFKISSIESESYYIMFKMEKNDPCGFIKMLNDKANIQGIDVYSLVGKNESPVFEKYDVYIPSELLRKAYAEDRLNAEEVCTRLSQIAKEYD